MEFDKLSLAKTAARWITIAGVSKIVKDVIHYNTDDPETLIAKIQILAGSFAIGGYIAQHISTYTDEKIDECVIFVDTIKNLNNQEVPK